MIAVGNVSRYAEVQKMSRRKWEVMSSIAALFASRGYHGVGMRELAQELGLNPGTLYHYFPSKDHALLAICLIGQAETHGNIVHALERDSAFPARIDTLFENHLSSLERVGDFIDVFSSQRDQVPPELAGPLLEGWTKTRALFWKLFEDAIAQGEIPADISPRDAVRVLLGIYRGANLLHRSGRTGEIRDFLGLAVRIFLNGIRIR